MPQVQNIPSRNHEHVYCGVRQDLELNHMNRAQSPWITMYKDVQAKYLDGAKSILQNFPCQSHQSKHCFLAPIKQYLFPTFQQIRCSIISCSWLWLLFPSCRIQWSLDLHNGFCSFLNDDVHYCERFGDLHRDVKEMMMNNPDITKATRVVILRVWSNGFEAHNVKGNLQFNSFQVFTVKLRGLKDHMLPYALCFKAFNVQKICVQLLEELFELRKLSPGYWGRTNKFSLLLLCWN